MWSARYRYHSDDINTCSPSLGLRILKNGACCVNDLLTFVLSQPERPTYKTLDGHCSRQALGEDTGQNGRTLGRPSRMCYHKRLGKCQKPRLTVLYTIIYSKLKQGSPRAHPDRQALPRRPPSCFPSQRSSFQLLPLNSPHHPRCPSNEQQN